MYLFCYVVIHTSSDTMGLEYVSSLAIGPEERVDLSGLVSYMFSCYDVLHTSSDTMGWVYVFSLAT